MGSYIAQLSFDDGVLGKVKRRQALELDESVAKRYVTAGLLKPSTGNAPDPTQTGGGKSSASPAGQASQTQTAKKQGRGASKKKAAPSS